MTAVLPDAQLLLTMYREMARARALGDEAVNMQRHGTLPGFVPCTGQEAAQVGSALALDTSRDFAFVTYREFAAGLALGLSPVDLLAHYRGYCDGGRFDPRRAHVSPVYSVVGATALHAVGWAMGAALDQTAGCALAYFGDGASSQGDLHEAMNFAAVFRAPVVFFCQNNGWAISVPARAQIGGGSVAARAAGYGLAGAQVDGNDVEAVHAATAAAVGRARDGGGATVIEAMTYRLGPHATSDDPRRYRSAEEEAHWWERDPLPRARGRLADSGAADAAQLAEIDRAVRDECDHVAVAVKALEPPDFETQLGLAYRDRPPQVDERHRAWLTEPTRG